MTIPTAPKLAETPQIQESETAQAAVAKVLEEIGIDPETVNPTADELAQTIFYFGTPVIHLGNERKEMKGEVLNTKNSRKLDLTRLTALGFTHLLSSIKEQAPAERNATVRSKLLEPIGVGIQSHYPYREIFRNLTNQSFTGLDQGLMESLYPHSAFLQAKVQEAHDFLSETNMPFGEEQTEIELSIDDYILTARLLEQEKSPVGRTTQTRLDLLKQIFAKGHRDISPQFMYITSSFALVELIAAGKGREDAIREIYKLSLGPVERELQKLAEADRAYLESGLSSSAIHEMIAALLIAESDRQYRELADFLFTSDLEQHFNLQKLQDDLDLNGLKAAINLFMDRSNPTRSKSLIITLFNKHRRAVGRNTTLFSPTEAAKNNSELEKLLRLKLFMIAAGHKKGSEEDSL